MKWDRMDVTDFRDFRDSDNGFCTNARVFARVCGRAICKFQLNKMSEK